MFDNPGDWALENGIRIGIILVIAIVAHVFAKRIIPRAVAVTLEPRSIAGGEWTEELRANREQRAATVSQVFLRTTDVLIFVVAAFLVLAEIGVSLAPLIAGAGIAGIAIAFGAQSLVRDALAGAFIILEDHYRTGDVVTLAGVTGRVEGVTLRRSLLRDLDGTLHSIPNGEVKVASNHTREWSGVNMILGVGYEEDVPLVEELVDRIGVELASAPEWAADVVEAPSVARVEAFGESSVELRIVAKTRPHRQWDVATELRRRILAGFAAEGIEIPFPHRVVINRDDRTSA